MKWLSKQYINDEARKGRKEALLCSRKHWEQLCSATQRELKEAPESIAYGMYCAMCHRYSGNDVCYSPCVLRCMSNNRWADAHSAFTNFEAKKCYSNFCIWRKYARIMLGWINHTIERLYGKGI